MSLFRIKSLNYFLKLVREQNMGCLFIGHDLALVRSVSHRIAIMYLGKVLEIIDSEDLEKECVHPYTKALLNSVFDVYCDQDEDVELLEGEPASSLEAQKGCVLRPDVHNAVQNVWKKRWNCDKLVQIIIHLVS